MNIEEVEEYIYECIRVAYLGLAQASLPEFINSVDEVVEEQCILDTYEPAPRP